MGSLYLQHIIIVFIITITRSPHSLESCCNNNIIIRPTDRHRFFTPLLQGSVYYYCLLCDDRHWRGKCVVENNTLLWYHIIIYYWTTHQLHTHVWRHRNFRICLVSVAFIPNKVQCYQFGMILYSYIGACTQPTHNIIRSLSFNFRRDGENTAVIMMRISINAFVIIETLFALLPEPYIKDLNWQPASCIYKIPDSND